MHVLAHFACASVHITVAFKSLHVSVQWLCSVTQTVCMCASALLISTVACRKHCRQLLAAVCYQCQASSGLFGKFLSLACSIGVSLVSLSHGTDMPRMASVLSLEVLKLGGCAELEWFTAYESGIIVNQTILAASPKHSLCHRCASPGRSLPQMTTLRGATP